jgi:hypothetical protein
MAFARDDSETWGVSICMDWSWYRPFRRGVMPCGGEGALLRGGGFEARRAAEEASFVFIAVLLRRGGGGAGPRCGAGPRGD